MTKIQHLLAGAAAVGLIVVWPLGGAAAQTRYTPWTDPNAPPAASESGLIDELKALVDKADRDRAASPMFLHDLRALIARHERPSVVDVLGDDFSDGDFTHNPTWTVTSGRYWIEKGYGLRSAVTVSASQPDGGRVSNKEVAAEVLGSLLNHALGGKSTMTNQPAQPAKVEPARIYTAATIPNAFTIKAELTSWKREGAFVIGPYQGARDAGYRLVYRPGQSAALELERVSQRGIGVVGSDNSPLNLEDKRVHTLTWTRTADGTMTVSVDGTERIKAVDRTFRASFAGMLLENRGGDYVLKSIRVTGQR